MPPSLDASTTNEPVTSPTSTAGEATAHEHFAGCGHINLGEAHIHAGGCCGTDPSVGITASSTVAPDDVWEGGVTTTGNVEPASPTVIKSDTGHLLEGGGDVVPVYVVAPGVLESQLANSPSNSVHTDAPIAEVPSSPAQSANSSTGIAVGFAASESANMASEREATLQGGFFGPSAHAGRVVSTASRAQGADSLVGQESGTLTAIGAVNTSGDELRVVAATFRDIPSAATVWTQSAREAASNLGRRGPVGPMQDATRSSASSSFNTNAGAESQRDGVIRPAANVSGTSVDTDERRLGPARADSFGRERQADARARADGSDIYSSRTEHSKRSEGSSRPTEVTVVPPVRNERFMGWAADRQGSSSDGAAGSATISQPVARRPETGDIRWARPREALPTNYSAREVAVENRVGEPLSTQRQQRSVSAARVVAQDGRLGVPHRARVESDKSLVRSRTPHGTTRTGVERPGLRIPSASLKVPFERVQVTREVGVAQLVRSPLDMSPRKVVHNSPSRSVNSSRGSTENMTVARPRPGSQFKAPERVSRRDAVSQDPATAYHEARRQGQESRVLRPQGHASGIKNRASEGSSNLQQKSSSISTMQRRTPSQPRDTRVSDRHVEQSSERVMRAIRPDKLRPGDRSPRTTERRSGAEDMSPLQRGVPRSKQAAPLRLSALRQVIFDRINRIISSAERMRRSSAGSASSMQQLELATRIIELLGEEDYEGISELRSRERGSVSGLRVVKRRKMPKGQDREQQNPQLKSRKALRKQRTARASAQGGASKSGATQGAATGMAAGSSAAPSSSPGKLVSGARTGPSKSLDIFQGKAEDSSQGE